MEKRSLREAINECRGLFKWMNSDTYQNIPDRLISSLLQNTALTYIKQTTDKRKLWNSPNLFKAIPCVALKNVSLSECCTTEEDKVISRSVYQLPKIAEGTHFGMLIQGIYSIDFPNPQNTSRRFIESTVDRFANSLGMKLKKKQIHFWIQDKYLYISEPNLEKIKILAYFEEDIPEWLLYYPEWCKNNNQIASCCSASAPEDINNIYAKDKTLACCPPNPYDEEFSCPGYMYTDVLNAVSNQLKNTYGSSQADNTTDGLDTTSMGGGGRQQRIRK